MWWNDIAEIKKAVGGLNETLFGMKKDSCAQDENILDRISESITEMFCSEDEFNSINMIHDKLNLLIQNSDIEQAVNVSLKTLDKFEGYMKNVDKLNAMINEFKGCVSLARGSLEERKNIEKKDLEHNLAVMTAANILKDETRSKIDYIYENMSKIADILQNLEKKSPKKKKSVRKKATPVP